MEAVALDYLNRDPLGHADMLVPIRRGSADILAAGPDGVLLLERQSQAFMLAAPDDARALRLCDAVQAPQLMCLRSEAAARAAMARWGLRLTMICHQAVWPGALPPDLPPSSFAVRPLSLDMAGRIEALYSHDIGLPYIEARLRAGDMWGAFDGDTLAGFAGIHAEGAMGMLEVLPDYRRRGMGLLLAAHLCRVQLLRGVTPFSQLTVDNHASRRLNLALGMKLCPGDIYWLEM